MSAQANGKAVIRVNSTYGPAYKVIHEGREVFARITPKEVRTMYAPNGRVDHRFDHTGKNLSRFYMSSYSYTLLRFKLDSAAEWTVLK